MPQLCVLTDTVLQHALGLHGAPPSRMTLPRRLWWSAELYATGHFHQQSCQAERSGLSCNPLRLIAHHKISFSLKKKNKAVTPPHSLQWPSKRTSRRVVLSGGERSRALRRIPSLLQSAEADYAALNLHGCGDTCHIRLGGKGKTPGSGFCGALQTFHASVLFLPTSPPLSLSRTWHCGRSSRVELRRARCPSRCLSLRPAVCHYHSATSPSFHFFFFWGFFYLC